MLVGKVGETRPRHNTSYQNLPSKHFLNEGDGASSAGRVVLPDHGAFVLAMVRASGCGRNCGGGHGSSAILAARIIAHNGGTLILAMVSAAGG